jgi:arylamine N-acetyltransferase
MSDGRPNHDTMSFPPVSARLIDRYLGILDVPAEEPSTPALLRLVEAQLHRVPFENLSKVYYMHDRDLRALPGLELYLDGIEQYHFGGTCYPNNYYFGQLLANLGYRATLCGADMANPDVHLVTMIEIEGRQFMVDTGYAAPFAAPLPRDLSSDHVVHAGPDRYLLRPQDPAGCSRMELHRDGQLKHGYLAKPTARRIDEFEAIIADSYRADSTFMNAILLARCFDDHFLVVHNLSVIESRGAEFDTRTLSSRDELVELIDERFGIPSRITHDVVHDFPSLEDPWN